MCAVLKISRSGYYEWKKRPPSRRSKNDDRLLELIKKSFNQSRGTYGYRRIYNDLRKKGEFCGRDQVARLMRENGIRPKTVKKFKVTTDSKHNKPIHENKLDRKFTAEKPNQSWVSDITYIETQEGWLYLAVVMDLFSRKIIGWSMSSRMQAELVGNALQMALMHRELNGELIFHSDRGSQYASDYVQAILNNNKLTCSMSRKGNCWDNAVMESFFHSLKTECIYHEKFKTREEAKKTIFDYIEVFYNRQRRHTFLDYCSPVEYEILMNAA